MKRKKFKEEEVFEIMRQILSGFSELIREKIVHRDLKPANILINEGIYKIGDFGFAKYVDNFGSQMLKSCVGSPIYMAPQILERSQYTTKCDIWSLGVIFYEMMFGYPPWKARDENELLRGIKTISITHILKRSSSLSARANDFLKKTLAYSE
jgi:calcium-dependent protein kinase